MKKIYLLLNLIFICSAGVAQYTPDHNSQDLKKFIEINPEKSFYKYNKSNELKPRASTESYFLNYGFTNQPTARDNNAGPSTVTFGKLNRNWPNSVRGTMQDVLQYVGRNGSIYHVFGFNNTSSKYVYNTINIAQTRLKVDSIRFPFFYDRKVNTTDSIVVSLYDLSDITIPNNQTNNGTPVSLSYNGAPLYRNAIPVTSSIAITDTFNFSGGTTFLYTNYLIKPNLTLPAGKAFAFRLEFVGDTANYFQPIFQTYDECNGGCVSTRAYIENTTGYLNYIFASTPPFNFSGAMNRQSMFACANPQDDCSYYFYQTYTASYFVTSTTNFNVNIDPVSNVRGCAGTNLDLASSYSGLDTVHKVSFLWRASRGTFSNGKDTITSTGPTYTFDTTGGFVSIILRGTATNSEVAADTLTLENWSMSPTLTTTGQISCKSTDSVRMSIANTAAVGINSQMVTAYDNITTLNLSTNLNHLNQYFALRYEWTGTGLYPRTDTTFTNAKTAGIFNLKITNFVGCSKTLNRTFTNSANPPVLDYTFTPSTNICPNKNVEFKVANSSIRSGWTYNWSESSTVLATSGVTITHAFTSSGVKSVKLNADSSGCKATEVSKNVTVLPATDTKCKVSISIADNDNLKIFPNPVRDGKIYIQNDMNLSLSYRVTDMLGKVISAERLISNKDSQIDLSNAPNGIYFIEVESKGEKVIKKIIVDKQ